MSRTHSLFVRALVLGVSVSASLTACADDQGPAQRSLAPETPVAASPTVIPYVPGDLSTSLTASGPLTNGSVSQFNVTITNAGTQSYTDTVFTWVMIPAGMKRQVDVPVPGSNPRIQCETYRGTNGGLTQSQYSDWCRIWFTTGVPAGQSVTAVVPVKLLAAGDFQTTAGTQVKQFYTYVALDQVWMTVHVSPATKVGGGGGGGGSGTPDLQAGAKSSAGSPAAGSTFTLTFTAKNIGKADAENPTFTATLPAGMTLAGSYYDFGSCTAAGQVVSCTTTHPVSAGTTATAMLTVVAPTVPGSYTTSGTWAITNGDANPADNTASVSVTVK